MKKAILPGCCCGQDMETDLALPRNLVEALHLQSHYNWLEVLELI